MPAPKHNGFILIELSIVLVIIGLIVGGIMVGQTLIRQYQLRSVISDVTAFKTAVNVFKMKYNALPGDMPNASAYWNCEESPDWFCTMVGDGGFNGGGDGFINDWYCDNHDGSFESLRAWEHLSLAGLVNGRFRVGIDNDRVLGKTVPASKMDNGGYELGCSGSSWFIKPVGHYVGFAASGGDQLMNSILIPSEAYAIDLKIDDGKPEDGKIIGLDGADVTAGKCDNTGNDTYKTTNTKKGCWLAFLF